MRISALRRVGENPSRGLEPVDAGQRAIHHNDLRLQLLRQPDCFFSIAGLARHRYINFVFQNAAKSTPHQRVIVH